MWSWVFTIKSKTAAKTNKERDTNLYNIILRAQEVSYYCTGIAVRQLDSIYL